MPPPSPVPGRNANPNSASKMAMSRSAEKDLSRVGSNINRDARGNIMQSGLKCTPTSSANSPLVSATAAGLSSSGATALSQGSSDEKRSGKKTLSKNNSDAPLPPKTKSQEAEGALADMQAKMAAQQAGKANQSTNSKGKAPSSRSSQSSNGTITGKEKDDKNCSIM
jgi:hypothetical protein